MPRTDLLDELGIYLTEKKNSQSHWTSLRDILEAVKREWQAAELPDGYSHLTAEQPEIEQHVAPLTKEPEDYQGVMD